MTQDPAQIVEAVNKSAKLELNPEKTNIGRKNNPPVPEFSKTGKRREQPEDEKEEMEYLKESDLNDPIVLEMVGPAEAKNSWRQVETAYKGMFPTRKVLYSRFDKGNGQVLISSHKQDVEKVCEKVVIKLDTEEFVIQKLEKEGLEKFWAEHGNHYNLCTNKKLSLSKLKRKKAEKEKRNPTISVTLGDYTYVH